MGALLQPADAPLDRGTRRVLALDDFYDSITFMEPSRPGFEIAFARGAAELDFRGARNAFSLLGPLIVERDGVIAHRVVNRSSLA